MKASRKVTVLPAMAFASVVVTFAQNSLPSWNDAEREWACDRKSHIGELDNGLDEAAAKGWTVESMKDDWKTIFPRAIRLTFHKITYRSTSDHCWEFGSSGG